MAFSLLYVLFAILGLGVIVLMHELGHYFMARRQGMKIEAFAIGFGKPLFTWEWQGVKWRICWLPFGGYVKIAGMQKEGNLEPHEVADGFYGKKPWQRIQVAFAGPLVNIVFAFAAFTLLWAMGGRTKPFYELTHRIGWVDPNSPLYQNGVRPGDVIVRYDGRPFQGVRDLALASVLSGETSQIQGYKIDYATGEKTHFDYTLRNYQDPRVSQDTSHTIGVAAPARYLIFNGPSGSLAAGSPMFESGIQPKDRLLWADGEVLFSPQQLSALINQSTAFLTVRRGDQIFQTKVPRVRIGDLKMTSSERGEIDDWQHEAGLKGKLQDLYFVPYNLSPTVAVESLIYFIDPDDQTKAFEPCQRCTYFRPLEEGDQILAVDGEPISSSYELLDRLQTRRVLLIVERDPQLSQKALWTDAESQFDRFRPADLSAIISSIGTAHPVTEADSLHLLSPIAPKSFYELPFSAEQKARAAQEAARAKKDIEAIQDTQKRAEQMREWEKAQRNFLLGIPLADREVAYNPGPGQQFGEVFEDTWRTLAGLVSGYLNPKYVSGPVGIVQVVHHSWMIGPKEALFWLAVISLNLGLINLLPIPILDGGHIVFSLWEMVTKRPLKSKTMERLIFPFIALMIALFFYVTYQDLHRLFSRFF